MKQSSVPSTTIDIAVYVSTVFALSTVLYLPLFLDGRSVSERPVMIIALMGTPAVAALLTRVIRPARVDGDGTQRTLRNAVLVFGLGGPGHRVRTAGAILGAIIFPIVTASIAYGVAWCVGLAEFTSPVVAIASEGGATSAAGPFSASGGVSASGAAPFRTIAPVVHLARDVLRAATLGTVFGSIIVLGEEIGWRGFLARRLNESDLPQPFVAGGVIWAAWHIPLILTGQYAGGPVPIVSALSFSLLAVALHSLWSRMFLSSGSLWPAIAGHSAWNTIIQFSFDGHTAGENASLWVGDSGVLVAAVAAVLAWCVPRLWRVPKTGAPR